MQKPFNSIPQGAVIMGSLQVQLHDGKTLEDLLRAIDTVALPPGMFNLSEVRTATVGSLTKEIWVYVGSFEQYCRVPFAVTSTSGSFQDAFELGDEDVDQLAAVGVCVSAHVAYDREYTAPPHEASAEGAAGFVSDLGFKVSGAGVHLGEFSVSLDATSTRNEAWLQFRVPDDLTFKGRV